MKLEMCHNRVTQIFNLLYRRFSICCASESSNRLLQSKALPTASRRYSRLKICATPEGLL